MAAVARRPPRYRREVNAERRQARRVGLYTGGTVDRQQRRMYILLAKFISKRGEVCPPIREVDTGRSEELRQCVLHELARMAACTACARECDHTYSSRRSRATDCKPLAASQRQLHRIRNQGQHHQAQDQDHDQAHRHQGRQDQDQEHHHLDQDQHLAGEQQQTQCSPEVCCETGRCGPRVSCFL